MSGDDTIEADGRIVRVMGNGRFEVEMPNGHRIVGFLSRARREAGESWRGGEVVTVRMSPSDMSKGRIRA